MLNFKKFFAENDSYTLQKIENLWIQFFNNPKDDFARSILSDLLKESSEKPTDENYQLAEILDKDSCINFNVIINLKNYENNTINNFIDRILYRLNNEYSNNQNGTYELISKNKEKNNSKLSNLLEILNTLITINNSISVHGNLFNIFAYFKNINDFKSDLINYIYDHTRFFDDMYGFNDNIYGVEEAINNLQVDNLLINIFFRPLYSCANKTSYINLIMEKYYSYN